MATDIEITRTVVDGAMGQLTVTFLNTGSSNLSGVRIVVASSGPISDNASGHLAFLPSTADGGYEVGNVASGASVSRSFAISPVDAEAGKTFGAQATVSWTAGSETADAEIFVEARPEVYAAIGAAETARTMLLSWYEDAKEKGREIHQDTALPESKGDPTQRVLQPSSFAWAMQMVELGVKMFKEGGPPRGSGPVEEDPPGTP